MYRRCGYHTIPNGKYEVGQGGSWRNDSPETPQENLPAEVRRTLAIIRKTALVAIVMSGYSLPH